MTPNQPRRGRPFVRISRTCQAEALETRRLMAVDYYVSPLGDAGNDGLTADKPITVAKLNTSVDLNPGDRVLLHGATYTRDGITETRTGAPVFTQRLSFTAEDGGTAAAPVTVRSYAAVVVTNADGTQTTTGQVTADDGDRARIEPPLHQEGLLVHNTAGFDVADLVIRGANPQGNDANGIRFLNSLSGGVKLEHVYIRNVDVSGFGWYGIQIKGENGASGFRDVEVRDSDLHGNARAGFYTYGTKTLYAHEDVRVINCRAYENMGDADFDNNSGSGIILSNVRRGLVERSVAHHNGGVGYGGGVGIWAHDSTEVVIQYNEAYGNVTATTIDGGGFDLDGGMSKPVMQYNYSHDNDGAGYGLYQYRSFAAWDGNTVRYNISQNDGRRNNYGAITLWDGGSGLKNADIYNNTIYVAPSGSSITKAVYFKTTTTNMRFRNNIFMVDPNAAPAQTAPRLIDLYVTRQPGLVFEGNNYFSTDPAKWVVRNGKAQYTTFAAFQTGMAQERLGGAWSDDNPRLTNPGGGGTLGDPALLGTPNALEAYKLLNDPNGMVDKGLDLRSLGITHPGPNDFYGTSLVAPQGVQYDVGAHELVRSA